ncbi:hypothetical protein BDQ17DRAFT_1429520 [Cyathus striatus]|nr:hypothetical protein BDQ17DRAFT_1429520 [Cyathus striatus]
MAGWFRPTEDRWLNSLQIQNAPLLLLKHTPHQATSFIYDAGALAYPIRASVNAIESMAAALGSSTHRRPVTLSLADADHRPGAAFLRISFVGIGVLRERPDERPRRRGGSLMASWFRPAEEDRCLIRCRWASISSCPHPNFSRDRMDRVYGKASCGPWHFEFRHSASLLVPSWYDILNLSVGWHCDVSLSKPKHTPQRAFAPS